MSEEEIVQKFVSEDVASDRANGNENDIVVVSQSDYEDKQFVRISRLHFAAFVFFLIQTVIYSALKVDLAVDPSVGYSTDCDGPICSANMKTYGDINPIWIIPVFTGLACFDHLLSWYCGYAYPETAKYWLFTVGSNPFRWIEYSISASLMAVAISILSGVHDIHLWMLIFFMHAIGMLLGQVIELLKRPEDAFLRKFVFGLASASIFIPWIVIMMYFFTSVTSSADSVPDFVYAAFLGTFILYITFGANNFAHNILGYYDFPTAEIVYIVLSFTSKTFLAGDVFGGLRAGEDDDEYPQSS